MVRLAFALSLMASMSIAQHAAASDRVVADAAYTRPAQRIDIGGGRSLNLFCTGSGTPTVVLEAGGASSTVVWGLVQPDVAARTRVCAYDRAGMGFSDASRRPSTSANDVDDLHALLVAAHVEPPYVLVAHSMGALVSRLYAARYPADVVGMVLVEPVSEYKSDAYRSVDPRHRSATEWRDQVERIDEPMLRRCVAASESGALRKGTRLWNACIDEPAPVYSDVVQRAVETFEAKPAYQRAALSEDVSFSASEQALRNTPNRFLGAMPLIVLTAGAPAHAMSRKENADDVWSALTARIATWSTCGENVVVPDVGHAIQLERPDVVVAAIDRVLTAIRDASRTSHDACPNGARNAVIFVNGR
jgi:pimeloyl-ACP methyl ester carboxylesterase